MFQFFFFIIATQSEVHPNNVQAKKKGSKKEKKVANAEKKNLTEEKPSMN